MRKAGWSAAGACHSLIESFRAQNDHPGSAPGYSSAWLRAAISAEVAMAAPGQCVEGVFVPDFHGIEGERVVAQFDFQGTQCERDFEEYFAECYSAVFTNDSFGAGRAGMGVPEWRWTFGGSGEWISVSCRSISSFGP